MGRRNDSSNSARVTTPGYRAQQGFALISFMFLVPLLVTVFLALAALFMSVRRKSLAQNECVQQTVQLQARLSLDLENLLKLNKKAELLRRRRVEADKAMKVAAASEQPELIAAAKAAQLAVILTQLALHTRQSYWLRQAREERVTSERLLKQTVERLGATDFHAHSFFPLGLAVLPVPPQSLTPSYKIAQPFSFLQQHRFRFSLELLPMAVFRPLNLRAEFIAQCSASLKPKGAKWEPQILAVNPSSNW